LDVRTLVRESALELLPSFKPTPAKYKVKIGRNEKRFSLGCRGPFSGQSCDAACPGPDHCELPIHSNENYTLPNTEHHGFRAACGTQLSHDGRNVKFNRMF
jgi:hypothetical protein